MKETQSHANEINRLKLLKFILLGESAAVTKIFNQSSDPKHLCKDLESYCSSDFKINGGLLSMVINHSLPPKHCYQIVSTLLNYGADTNISDRDGTTALHLAAKHDEKKFLLPLLLRHGANPNFQDQSGYTPLHHIVAINDIPGIKLLVGYQANAHIPYSSGGMTPFDVAFYLGNDKTSSLLLQITNLQSFDASLYLPEAAKKGMIHTVKVLSKLTDINHQDFQGKTALHNAVANKHLNITSLLFKMGANINQKDKDGISPLDHALELGNNDILNILTPYRFSETPWQDSYLEQKKEKKREGRW